MCMLWHNLASRISDTSQYGVFLLSRIVCLSSTGLLGAHKDGMRFFDHLIVYGLGGKVVTMERNHLLAWG